MTLSWLSNSCFGISTNLTQIKHPMCDSDKININGLFVSGTEIWLMETIVDNSSVKTVKKKSFATFRQST